VAPALAVEEAAQGFAAVGSEPRLMVLRMLVRAGTEGLTVGEIQDRVSLPASTLAHHLRFLAAGGLIEQERQGRSVLNRAAYRRLESLAAFLLNECCTDARPSPQARAARAALRS
jgi:DNA-binding transcriptional ArsR family regulator